MLMILINHFSGHGGFQFSVENLSVNRLWTQFTLLGNIGVDIFVLISGYFLVGAQEVKISKVIKTWLQIVTYSILIYCFFVAFGIESWSIKTFVKRMIPVSHPQWWFASTYFVMYLLSPYINKLLRALNKSLYKRMLVSLSIYWCLIPMFLLSNFEGNNLLWFIYLYSVAGYTRLYAKKTGLSAKKYLLYAVIAYLLLCIATAVQDILVIKSKYFGYISLNTRQSIPVLLISILLFLAFLKMDVPYNKLVNVIASTTFGIYLIHDDNFVRPFLWKTVFKNASYSYSLFLIPYSIGVTILVFACSMAIEMIRLNVLEKRYLFLVQRISQSIDKQIERLFSSSFLEKI